MKTHIKNRFVLPVLITVLGLILACPVTAQTFTTLYSFTASRTISPGVYTNCDGAGPNGLILSDDTLYGTAQYGGSSWNGTVFKLNTDGTGFTNLHTFGSYPNDGRYPQAGLILSGNMLYGTTRGGGNFGDGVVFKVNTDGTGFTNLHSFPALQNLTNSDGANPVAGLILSGNALYGTAQYGGSSGKGTVFAVNTDGTGFTILHSFTTSWTNSSGFYTNNDGADPGAGLVLSGSTLYGTAHVGGSSGTGTVFAVNTDGRGFTNLHSFTDGSDGANPWAGLVLSANTLHGTAEWGGSSGNGTVFKLNTDGMGFTTLYSFTAVSGAPWGGPQTNSDGANLVAGLILSGNTLYGTARYGGSSGKGTVFAVNTDGTGFTILHSFTTLPPYPHNTKSDGANPVAGLILSGNTLYGTAFSGGSSGNGTVFSLLLPTPQLTIVPSATNVILSWPTNYAGFDYTGYILQSTTNFASSAVWSTNLPSPVVVNGQNTVTNPITGTQQFFRLSQ